jgi:hypothetical protein
MAACIEQHEGRVVDAVGDNLLTEFDSAVGAVQSAVEVQKELRLIERFSLNLGVIKFQQSLLSLPYLRLGHIHHVVFDAVWFYFAHHIVRIVGSSENGV